MFSPEELSPFTFLIAFLMGASSAYFAHSKKKNPYLWFVVGFIFGALGIMALFFLPKYRKAPKKRAIRKPVPTLVGPAHKFWYYVDPTHTQVGPVSYRTIVDSLQKGALSKTTYVWHEEMEDWKKIEDLIVLKS